MVKQQTLQLFRNTFWVVLIFLLAGGIAFSQEKPLIAVSNSWAPFVDDNNPTDGLSLEIIRAAYKTQGYEVTMLYIPWARAVSGVKSGSYDLLPNAWLTEEREEYLHFSLPYVQNNIRFIKRTDDPFQYTGLDSLSGKTVGIIRDYAYSQTFTNANNFEKEPVNDLITNIQKLLMDRIDLTLADEIVAYFSIKNENPNLFSQITFLSPPLSTENLYVAVGYENPNHEAIIEAFNKGLKKIQENGIYDEIMKRYGVEE